MARDEMAQITADRWDEDIWGAAMPAIDNPRPRLVFYFGKDDHWVANRSRNELIAKHGWRNNGEDWKARMFVDEVGIPHAFCISEHTMPQR